MRNALLIVVLATLALAAPASPEPHSNPDRT